MARDPHGARSGSKVLFFEPAIKDGILAMLGTVRIVLFAQMRSSLHVVTISSLGGGGRAIALNIEDLA